MKLHFSRQHVTNSGLIRLMDKQKLNKLKIMKKIICSIVILCSITQLYAQSVIRGKVVDSGGKPLEFVTVALYSANDSVLKQGAITGANGQFVIEKVNQGSYFITVSMIGFEKKSSAVSVANAQTYTVPDIVLNEASLSLGEITVTATKKFVEQQADKMIINPEASITTASDDALEVLRKSPGIIVDKDDNITLKNKQVRVMIDGRPSYMSGQELAAMLRNMQASSIDRIEIIENPSSRFDAEGDGGIINIRTKRGMMRGYNGSLTLGAAMGKRFSDNYGIDLNYRAEKLNIYGNSSGGQSRNWNSLDWTRRFMQSDGSSYKQYGVGKNQSNYNNVRVGVDYYITPKQVIGFMARGNIGAGSNSNVSNANIADAAGGEIQQIHTDNSGENKWNNLLINLNYKWTIDSLGKELSIDADMAKYNSKAIDDMNTSYIPPQSPEIFHKDQRGIPDFYSIKADYVWPVNPKTRLEMGVKSSWATIDSDLDYKKLDANNDWIDHNGMSNRFIYKENINAAYISGNYRFSDKTSLQFGLRGEQTISTGNNVTSNQTNKRDYFNLFPSFFVQQKLNDNHQLGFSYSYRVGRPPYNLLNPFMWMIDPYTYQKGNPYLNPQFTHAAKLSYTLKSKYIFSIDYSNTKDVFTQLLEQDDNTRTTTINWANLNNYYNSNLTAVLPVQVAKWFRTNTTLTMLYGQYKSKYQGGEIDHSQFSFRGNTAFTFTLPKDFSIELSGWYSSKSVYGGTIYFNPQGSIDGGVQKLIFNKKATLRLNVSDIFNTGYGSYSSKYDNIDLVGKERWDSRRVRLAFTWRFGRDDIKAARQRRAGLEEETGRM